MGLLLIESALLSSEPRAECPSSQLAAQARCSRRTVLGLTFAGRQIEQGFLDIRRELDEGHDLALT